MRDFPLGRKVGFLDKWHQICGHRSCDTLTRRLGFFRWWLSGGLTDGGFSTYYFSEGSRGRPTVGHTTGTLGTLKIRFYRDLGGALLIRDRNAWPLQLDLRRTGNITNPKTETAQAKTDRFWGTAETRCFQPLFGLGT